MSIWDNFIEERRKVVDEILGLGNLRTKGVIKCDEVPDTMLMVRVCLPPFGSTKTLRGIVVSKGKHVGVSIGDWVLISNTTYISVKDKFPMLMHFSQEEVRVCAGPNILNSAKIIPFSRNEKSEKKQFRKVKRSEKTA